MSKDNKNPKFLTNYIHFYFLVFPHDYHDTYGIICHCTTWISNASLPQMFSSHVHPKFRFKNMHYFVSITKIFVMLN